MFLMPETNIFAWRILAATQGLDFLSTRKSLRQVPKLFFLCLRFFWNIFKGLLMFLKCCRLFLLEKCLAYSCIWFDIHTICHAVLKIKFGRTGILWKCFLTCIVKLHEFTWINSYVFKEIRNIWKMSFVGYVL